MASKVNLVSKETAPVAAGIDLPRTRLGKEMSKKGWIKYTCVAKELGAGLDHTSNSVYVRMDDYKRVKQLYNSPESYL